MLVLTRKLGEKIILDGDIEVMVSRIEPGKCRLSVDAPDGVQVHRKEVWDAIQREKARDGEGTP